MSDFEREQQRNLVYFGERLPKLLQEHAGKVVVIRSADVAGVFEDLEKALSYGIRTFGLNPFLVQTIEPLRERMGDFHLACRA